MGLHEGRHGRVFRGLKKSGQKAVPYSKRSDEYTENVHNFIHRQAQGHNTNGDKPIMRVPEGFPAQKSKDDSDDSNDNDKPVPKLAQKAQAEDDSGVQTVYENVYETLFPTFEGPPQFYTTQSVEPTSTRASHSAAETTAAPDNSRKQDDDDDENQTPSRRPAAQSTATSAPEHTSSSASVSRAATSTDEDESSATSSAIDITSSAITSGDVASTRGAMLADNTSSMIGGTPLSATESSIAEPEQTRMTGGAQAGLAVGIIFGLALVFGLVFFCWRRKKSQRELEEYNEKSGVAAPVPVNRFSSDSDRLRRTSTQTSATAPRLSLRPVTQFLPNLTAGTDQNTTHTQNPFGDAAVVSEKNGHDRTNSDSDKSVESAAPATPASAQFATAAAVPVARGPNNVHRVQLEFKPSMEDELELKSGQLVRMVHEYDDGWVSSLRAAFPLIQYQVANLVTGTLLIHGPQP